EVGRRADAGIGAHVDAGMPEQPRHEGGDADIGRVPRRHRADIARERKLRDVEFLVAEGAKEDLFRIKRQVGDLAAFHLDTAVPDGAGTVVVAARNGYRHLHHWGLLLGFALGWGGRKAAERKLKSSAKRTCFLFGCEGSPCCTLSCAIFFRLRRGLMRACSPASGSAEEKSHDVDG